MVDFHQRGELCRRRKKQPKFPHGEISRRGNKSVKHDDNYGNLSLSLSPPPHPHSGELRTQKFKFHLLRTQSLKVLPLKPRVDQYIATYATLTAGDFFPCE